MAEFATIKAHVGVNLDDTGTFYNTTDLSNSLQDAYDDIAVLTTCIIKKVTLSFTDFVYYDFKALGVSDFLAVTAIYNNVTKRWLRDDKSTRDFGLMRDDWELWTGSPEFWASISFKYTAIVPKKATGTFDLYYWATAPLATDSDTPLLPTDLQKLLEYYSTPDLLEQAEEFTKSAPFWDLYFELIEIAKTRFRNSARVDLLRLA